MVQVGSQCANFLLPEVVAGIHHVLASHLPWSLTGLSCSGRNYLVELIPLTGRFQGRGLLIVFSTTGNIETSSLSPPSLPVDTTAAESNRDRQRQGEKP
jgi:hypothetical protein